MTNCDSNESMKALGYLTRSFGGYGIPDDEQRSFLRLFRKFPPAVVNAAIDELVVKSSRRPSPNDLAQVMRKSRPAVADTRTAEPWPEPPAPEVVSEYVRKLKALAKGTR